LPVPLCTFIAEKSVMYEHALKIYF